MNRTSKMGGVLFQEKMFLRKKVNCQEMFVKKINYKVFFKQRIT